MGAHTEANYMRRSSLLISVSLVTAFIAVSCIPYDGPAPQTGGISVEAGHVPSGCSWVCTATDGETVVERTGDAPSFMIRDAEPGEWTVSLTAYDRDGWPVMWQSMDVTVRKGLTAHVSFPGFRYGLRIERTPEEGILFRLAPEFDADDVMWVLYPEGSSGWVQVYTLDGEDNLIPASDATLCHLLLSDGTDAWPLRWSYSELRCIVTKDGRQKTVSTDPRD